MRGIDPGLNLFNIKITGTAWGYIESFLFWLLQDLGASRSLMGITITVGGIAGLPLLVLSGPIIRKLGHANVLFIGFVFYAIRLLGNKNDMFLTMLSFRFLSVRYSHATPTSLKTCAN